MKKILITGKTGYLSQNLLKWLNATPEKYGCDCLSLREHTWHDTDLSKYDAILHTAAIVHQRERKANAISYRLINTDLTYELASKAKHSGVRHFIFISSMSVYGLDGQIGKPVIISADTSCNPCSCYGKSKLEAENLILGLQDSDFIVSIVRPPMIYGPNCPGNYSRLRKLAMSWSLFPDIQNERSMIFIDNLCNMLEQLIASRVTGIFLPQNNEFVSTTEMIKLIAEQHGRKPILSQILGKATCLIKINLINKIYGNLTYKKPPAEPEPASSCIIGFAESIYITEKNWE